MLGHPSAANKIIWARWTSQCARVYCAARAVNACRSSGERTTRYGLCLGIGVDLRCPTTMSGYARQYKLKIRGRTYEMDD